MRRLPLYVLGYLLIFIQFTSAATSDEFRIRLYGAEDTEPPTTPTITSATPVSDSQIDIVWTASTDNVQLDGYQVFRDSVFIATTTLTTYSDTGLTASTTYTYEVRAFDWLFQYSSTSLPVATTTLAPPPAPTATPTSTPTPGSASGVVTVTDFDLRTDRTSATFIFETNRPSRFVLRWGRTDLYDGGYIASDVYRFDHDTTITGLEPGTTYEYELIGYSPAGLPNVLKRGRFITAMPEDREPPANVSGLTAVLEGDGVRLWWINPPDADLSYVRVLRSHLYYPIDIADGALVYQGTGEQVFDGNAFRLGETQYYTVFSVDADGNISSGAIVYIRRTADGGFQVGGPGAGLPGELPPEVTVVPPDEPVAFGTLDPGVIEVEQGSRLMYFDSELSLEAGRLTLVRIPYESVPERLKAIMVSFNPADGPAHTYLLKINRDKTYYEARLRLPHGLTAGMAEFAVYDLEQAMVSYVRQRYVMIESRPGVSDRDTDGVALTDRIATYTPLGILVLLLLLLLLFLYWFLISRRREGRSEESVARSSRS